MHCVLATEQFVRFQTGCLLWTVEVLRKDTVVIWANIIAKSAICLLRNSQQKGNSSSSTNPLPQMHTSADLRHRLCWDSKTRVRGNAQLPHP